MLPLLVLLDDLGDDVLQKELPAQLVHGELRHGVPEEDPRADALREGLLVELLELDRAELVVQNEVVGLEVLVRGLVDFEEALAVVVAQGRVVHLVAHEPPLVDVQDGVLLLQPALQELHVEVHAGHDDRQGVVVVDGVVADVVLLELAADRVEALLVRQPLDGLVVHAVDLDPATWGTGGVTFRGALPRGY